MGPQGPGQKNKRGGRRERSVENHTPARRGR
jgi:hypothetical protein